VPLTAEAGGPTSQFDLVCVHSFAPLAGASITAVDVRLAENSSAGTRTSTSTSTSTKEAGAAACCLMAIGAETGDLQVWKIASSVSGSAAATTADVGELASAVSVELLLTVPDARCHGATVRRVRWKPSSSSSNMEPYYELASCSEDRTVRVHRVW
jgi:hypothetical protein